MEQLIEVEDRMPADIAALFRFKVGDKVWVRDRGHGMTQRGGYSIEEAVVTERHYHPDRHPFYPNGEGYELDGNLWWSCYPGCRVFATRGEAINARMSETPQQ